MIQDQLLVTVNILSFNRRDELRISLTKVFEQHYKNIEVIVVDNASHDGSANMVEKEFPAVQLIKLKKNIGIAGWNEGFRIANGEFVLVLDDDSYPYPNAINNAVEFMQANTDVGIAAFNIYNSYFKRNETDHLLEHTTYFIGCGALIRKKLLNAIGYFNVKYFIYNHELDFSIRAINAQWKVELLNNSVVEHNQSMKNRGVNETNPLASAYRFKHEAISYSIFLIQNFSFPNHIIVLAKWLLNRTIVAVVHLYIIELVEVFARIVWYLPKWFNQRNQINTRVQKLFNYGNIPLIDRNFFPSITTQISKVKK